MPLIRPVLMIVLMMRFTDAFKVFDTVYVMTGGGPGNSTEMLPNYIWQHRTIASASLSRLFAPLPQFQKWEIHTVFLHFRNFELGQKFWLRLLAELRGVAIYNQALKYMNVGYAAALAFVFIGAMAILSFAFIRMRNRAYASVR